MAMRNRDRCLVHGCLLLFGVAKSWQRVAAWLSSCFFANAALEQPLGSPFQEAPNRHERSLPEAHAFQKRNPQVRGAKRIRLAGTPFWAVKENQRDTTIFILLICLRFVSFGGHPRPMQYLE